MLYILVCILTVLFILMLNTNFIRKSVYSLICNLPSEITIMHLSDIHGRTRFLNGKLSSLIIEVNPDVIFITGDLTTTPRQVNSIIQELMVIQERGIPTYFVHGNYEREYRRNFKKHLYTADEFQKRTNQLSKHMTILENEGQKVTINGVSLYVYGFDNSFYGNEQNLSEENGDSDFTCYLAHSPSIISYVTENGLDFNLLLAGHTHGGQIQLFNKMIGPYKHFHVGLKKLKDKQYFYITTGIGTVRIPLRVNSNPEIAIFKVK
ncbi:metallophosphoesterase [Ornithinibacillus scapharcae]|uniref:metallophosphoesterase n=1 Tax=Ornithinibacillus scapharcae TaxID=1147159 RepID=UPI000225B9BC|nr:metallophosphoesterase [Ornithinibacillus scapharcae]